jgi:hypothetical protein
LFQNSVVQIISNKISLVKIKQNYSSKKGVGTIAIPTPHGGKESTNG